MRVFSLTYSAITLNYLNYFSFESQSCYLILGRFRIKSKHLQTKSEGIK